jgi:tRNA pseudouridine(38-40) synthase
MEGGEAGKVDHGDEPQQDAGKQFWLDRPAGPPHAGLSTQDAEEELPYLQMLNAVLPPPIRAIAWCPVEPNFNARFACTRRSYRYFFTKGDLDIARMKEACALLIGQHDFRNFCKIDKSKGPNQSYCRHIIDFQVEPVVAGEGQGRYAPWSFNIVATAFLWHQVRAMAAVLFAIGRCEQPPSFVSFMLDIARCPVKPAYNIASEEPLLLCDCIFPGDLINWQPPLATHARNDAVVSAMCSSLVCRAALVEAMSVSLASRSVRTGPSSENGKRQQARGAADDAATGAAAEACHSSGGGGGAARSVDMVAFASVPRAEVRCWVGLAPCALRMSTLLDDLSSPRQPAAGGVAVSLARSALRRCCGHSWATCWSPCDRPACLNLVQVLGLVPNTGRSLLAPPPGCKFESASVDDAGPDKSVGSKRKLDT